MPERKKARIANLRTIGQVASEIGRVYRQARRGEINTQDASRLASVLTSLRQCLEVGDLERKLADLESTVNADAKTDDSQFTWKPPAPQQSADEVPEALN